MIRDTRVFLRPFDDGCLTCPPDPLRIVSRILVAELNATRILAERGNRRAVTATLALYRRQIAILARFGLLPGRSAAELGFTAGQCNQIVIADARAGSR